MILEVEYQNSIIANIVGLTLLEVWRGHVPPVSPHWIRPCTEIVLSRLTSYGIATSAVRILENSNRIVALLFDSKRMQLFEVFKHLSLVHNAVSSTITATTIAKNAPFGRLWASCRFGCYSRRKRRQIVGLRTAKTIRFDSKWKTTIRTALIATQTVSS